MNNDVVTMFRALTDREPTADDYKLIRRLTHGLPSEIFESPAMMAEIVLCAELLHQLQVIIKQASWDAQQRIHANLEPHVEKAALAALNKIRDLLPIDASDRLGRLLKWVVIWTFVVLVIAALSGWYAQSYFTGREQAQHQALYEREFIRCVDAAKGVAIAPRGRGDEVRYDSAIYAQAARVCAAEYADRRASS